MTRISISMHVCFRLSRGLHHLANFIRDLDTAQLGVSASDGFGERKNIWFDVPMLKRKPFPSTTKACDDFIRNKEHLVFITDRAHQREIIVWRDDHTTHSHHWFSDERRDCIRAFAQDRFFQFARRGLTNRLACLQLTLIAIWIRCRDVNESLRRRTKHRVIFFETGCEGSGQRYAMIGTFARNDFVLRWLALALPVIARGLER